MTLTCPKCGATHMVDTPSGARRALRFRCTECGHAFTVDPAQLDTPRTPAGLPVSVGPARGETTRTPAATVVMDVRPDAILSVLAGADTWAVDTPETLLAWILEGRVLPEDIGLEASGRRTVLAARPGLAPFFAAARVLDDVRTGRLVPAHRTAAPTEDPRDVAAEEEPPYEALVPPPDLAEDPPTIIMSPEVLAALAAQEQGPGDGQAQAQAQAQADAVPVADMPVLALSLAPLTASPTEEATVALAENPPVDRAPELAQAAEVTTGIPAPVEADPFDWSAPPPPPARGLPWGKLSAVAVVVAGLAVALVRGGGSTPPPAAPSAEEPSTGTAAAAPPPVLPPSAQAPQSQTPAVAGSAGADLPTTQPPVRADAPPAPTPTPAATATPAVPANVQAPVPQAVPAKVLAPAAATVAQPPAAATTVAQPPAPAASAAPRPRNAAALVKSGWAAVEGGDLAKARGLFADAVSAGGGATALHGRGYTRQQLGDIDGAVADYCAALAANPPGDVRAEAQTFLQRSKRSCPTATP